MLSFVWGPPGRTSEFWVGSPGSTFSASHGCQERRRSNDELNSAVKMVNGFQTKCMVLPGLIILLKTNNCTSLYTEFLADYSNPNQSPLIGLDQCLLLRQVHASQSITLLAHWRGAYKIPAIHWLTALSDILSSSHWASFDHMVWNQ